MCPCREVISIVSILFSEDPLLEVPLYVFHCTCLLLILLLLLVLLLKNFTIKPLRMLFLTMTDGCGLIKGMEYQLIKQLSVQTPPGTKVAYMYIHVHVHV